MIDEARKLHGEYSFEVCSMLKLSDSVVLENQTFDAILFLASFHHLETREGRIQILMDMKKYLTPNGRIYMTNWNLLEQARYKKSHR